MLLCLIILQAVVIAGLVGRYIVPEILKENKK